MKLLAALLPLVFAQQCLYGQGDRLIPHNSKNESLRYEVKHAIDKGLKWLEEKQNPAGYWDGSPTTPLTYTAQALTTLERSPTGDYKSRESVRMGYAYILRHVQRDGGIYPDKFRDDTGYATSICIRALLAADDRKFDPTLHNARRFLVGPFVAAEKGDKPFNFSSVGLEEKAQVFEALRATENLHGDPRSAGGTPDPDLNWEAAIKFVQPYQNLPGFNKADWVSDRPSDNGGFVMFPGLVKGSGLPADGPSSLASFREESYKGLLCYIYLGLKRDDPRMEAVIGWIQRNYSLGDNPVGVGSKYSYYHSIAKALATYGMDKVKLPDGTEADWKNDLAKKLINLQHDEGHWGGDATSGYDKDPMRATIQAVLALEYIYQAQ